MLEIIRILKFSVTALGLPGKLMISVLFATPHTALDKHASGVILIDSDVMYVIIDCHSFSITDLVASGVTSLGPKPVPPEVSIKWIASFCTNALSC